MSAVLTVSQINTYVKSLIDYDDNLKYIFVSGEIFRRTAQVDRRLLKGDIFDLCIRHFTCPPLRI